MALWDSITQFLALEPWQARSIDTFDSTTPLATQLAAIQGLPRPWRAASISEAMGVPAIQRAVTLISNSVGSLPLEAYRNGGLVETPKVVVRPDPFSTPEQFYSDAGYALATRGETVFWIASRDGLGYPTALIVVPLHELQVEENPRNRLMPAYTWGTIKGTRYTPANPRGEFVHVFYLRKHRFALRGTGPLQFAGAAASVSVESQEWAANFYAGGGNPSVNLHSPADLADGEAEALRNQWIGTPANMPQVTSGDLELRDVPFNEQAAQLLEAREYQNGDAARLFGIPGSLMEYNTPGAALTYQNLAEVWIGFVRGSLSINYLEKIEQALTDLLPRAMVVRFAVSGLQRADEETRWKVYTAAVGVIGPEEAADLARRREGLVAGDIERAPVPAAPPAAIPPPLQNRSTAVRCEGMRLLRGRLTECGKLLAEGGPFTGTCPRCKKEYAAA